MSRAGGILKYDPDFYDVAAVLICSENSSGHFKGWIHTSIWNKTRLSWGYMGSSSLGGYNWFEYLTTALILNNKSSPMFKFRCRGFVHQNLRRITINDLIHVMWKNYNAQTIHISCGKITIHKPYTRVKKLRKKETTIGFVHLGKCCTRKSCPLSSLIWHTTVYHNPTITSPRGGMSLTQSRSLSYLPDFDHSCICLYARKIFYREVSSGNGIYASQLVRLCILDAPVLRE